jgi:ribosomal protein S3
MGQKTHPNILRLGITKNWNYKYLEKKSSELPLYDFNNIEIKNFIIKFCKNNNFYVNECKINYSENNTLQIFISYYAQPEVNYVSNNFKVNNKTVKEFSYKTMSYLLKLPHNKLKNKSSVLFKKNMYKSYSDSIKSSDNFNVLKKNNTFLNNLKMIDINLFIKDLSESLYIFLNNKIKLNITLQQLNKNLKKKVCKKDLQLLKKNLAKFDRYRQQEFFTNGINILYTCSQLQNSATLLAEFIAKELPNLKRHNFFLKFVKDCLKTFKSSKSSTLKGVKIKIKGRINKRPRAKHKTLKIGKEISLLSIKSNIDYSEKVAFTPNGTLGVKVWTL